MSRARAFTTAAQDVRPDQVLEDVEDVRILGDLQHPRAEQVRLRLHLLDVGDACLEALEARVPDIKKMKTKSHLLCPWVLVIAQDPHILD
ncbi:MAG: hypothetical protein ACREK9_10270, partial [Candidatus Rokuibacteriota bacterium]